MKSIIVALLVIASVVLSGWVFLALAFTIAAPPVWVLALAVVLLGLATIITLF